MNISNIISTMLTKLKTYTDNKVADIKKYPYNWNETNSSNKGYIKNKPTSLPANGGNVTKVSGYSIWSGTQYAYDSIIIKDPSTLYFIKEGSTTSNIVYLVQDGIVNNNTQFGPLQGCIGISETAGNGIEVVCVNSTATYQCRRFNFGNKVGNKVDSSLIEKIIIKWKFTDASIQGRTGELVVGWTSSIQDSYGDYSNYTNTITNMMNLTTANTEYTIEFVPSNWSGENFLSFATRSRTGNNAITYYITEIQVVMKDDSSPGGTSSSIFPVKNVQVYNNTEFGALTTSGNVTDNSGSLGIKVVTDSSNYYAYTTRFSFDKKFDMSKIEKIIMKWSYSGSGLTGSIGEVFVGCTSTTYNTKGNTNDFTGKLTKVINLSQGPNVIEIAEFVPTNWSGEHYLSFGICSSVNGTALTIAIAELEIVLKDGSGGSTDNDILVQANMTPKINLGNILSWNNNILSIPVKRDRYCRASFNPTFNFEDYSSIEITAYASSSTTIDFYVSETEGASQGNVDMRPDFDYESQALTTTSKTYTIDISSTLKGSSGHLEIQTRQASERTVYITSLKLIRKNSSGGSGGGNTGGIYTLYNGCYSTYNGSFSTDPFYVATKDRIPYTASDITVAFNTYTNPNDWVFFSLFDSSGYYLGYVDYGRTVGNSSVIFAPELLTEKGYSTFDVKYFAVNISLESTNVRPDYVTISGVGVTPRDATEE